jgi:hypothetical protein
MAQTLLLLLNNKGNALVHDLDSFVSSWSVSFVVVVSLHLQNFFDVQHELSLSV